MDTACWTGPEEEEPDPLTRDDYDRRDHLGYNTIDEAARTTSEVAANCYAPAGEHPSADELDECAALQNRTYFDELDGEDGVVAESCAAAQLDWVECIEALDCDDYAISGGSLCHHLELTVDEVCEVTRF